MVDSVLPVSRETAVRLRIYVDLLKRWQPRINLVAPKTLEDVWRRHVADGAQALAAVPDAKHWLDLGSGAGFPGLVTACFLADDPEASVTLIESDQRKSAFLRAVIREAGLPAEVITGRIESVLADWDAPIDAISARALAPLSALCEMIEPVFSPGMLAVFHKGRDFSRELEEANRTFVLDLVEQSSKIDPDGKIVLIKDLMRR
ncbi:MAG: 16S rRNA (guanine(527)-N(7))-methyltransferase RsmG [Hyphomicrobiales bacterium]|nr:MAG: 16S rRNA (guanine(527)-N(7))-methyltransferase RsmG [Hyphomicrobiales bacterium]